MAGSVSGRGSGPRAPLNALGAFRSLLADAGKAKPGWARGRARPGPVLDRATELALQREIQRQIVAGLVGTAKRGRPPDRQLAIQRRLVGELVERVRRRFGITARRGRDDKLSARARKHARFTAYRVTVAGRDVWGWLSAVDIVHDFIRQQMAAGQRWRVFSHRAIEKAHEDWLKGR